MYHNSGDAVKENGRTSRCTSVEFRPSHERGSPKGWKKDSADAHHTSCYFDPGAIGSLANLAIQPCVGLLPDRWTGDSPDHRDHPDAALNRAAKPILESRAIGCPTQPASPCCHPERRNRGPRHASVLRVLGWGAGVPD